MDFGDHNTGIPVLIVHNTGIQILSKFLYCNACIFTQNYTGGEHDRVTCK